jgi:hypothetical protein
MEVQARCGAYALQTPFAPILMRQDDAHAEHSTFDIYWDILSFVKDEFGAAVSPLSDAVGRFQSGIDDTAKETQRQIHDAYRMMVSKMYIPTTQYK